MMAIALVAATLIQPIDWEEASCGTCVIDSETQEVLADTQSEKAFVPGSTMKLVTTGAALHLLGPEHRFSTELVAQGEIVGGILEGNLVLRGGGDPTLGSERLALSWEKQIEKWVQAVKKRGVHTIVGTVTADSSLWEEALAPPSWQWEDIGNYYGAGASALSFHENAYRLTLKPGKALGERVTIVSKDPDISTILLLNEITTGPAQSGDQTCVYGSEFTPLQIARGTIPIDAETFTIKVALPHPSLAAAELLKKALQQAGIVLEEKSIAAQGKEVLDTTLSPPLSAIVHATNQKSINLYAEHLLKAMGGGSTVKGVVAVTAFWKGQGVDLKGFSMADGSGLSRKNLITAKQLVSILLKMEKSPHSALYKASLEQVREGILAKSGSMSQIKSYAGYGPHCAYAILINGITEKEKALKKLDQFHRSLK